MLPIILCIGRCGLGGAYNPINAFGLALVPRQGSIEDIRKLLFGANISQVPESEPDGCVYIIIIAKNLSE